MQGESRFADYGLLAVFLTLPQSPQLTAGLAAIGAPHLLLQLACDLPEQVGAALHSRARCQQAVPAAAVIGGLATELLAKVGGAVLVWMQAGALHMASNSPRACCLALCLCAGGRRRASCRQTCVHHCKRC